MRRPDRRRIGRQSCRFGVRFGSANQLRDHFITNIAHGGVFVETLYPLRIGTVVELEVVVGEDPAPIKIRGEVVWVKHPSEPGEPGMGVRFLELPTEIRRRLAEILAAEGHEGRA